MLRLAPALTLLLCASAAEALETPPVCKAVNGLAEAARHGEPQRLTLTAGSDGCERSTPGAATAEFCATMIGAPLDVAPWLIDECVRTVVADAQIFTSPEPSGYGRKPVITRLTAKLGGGVRLDVSRTAARYDVVVWKRD